MATEFARPFISMLRYKSVRKRPRWETRRITVTFMLAVTAACRHLCLCVYARICLCMFTRTYAEMQYAYTCVCVYACMHVDVVDRTLLRRNQFLASTLTPLCRP